MIITIVPHHHPARGAAKRERTIERLEAMLDDKRVALNAALGTDFETFRRASDEVELLEDALQYLTDGEKGDPDDPDDGERTPITEDEEENTAPYEPVVA